MPFVKVTKKQKNDMLRSGGYRERDIVSKARFAVKGNKGRTVTFYKPHTRHGHRLSSENSKRTRYILRIRKNGANNAP